MDARHRLFMALLVIVGIVTGAASLRSQVQQRSAAQRQITVIVKVVDETGEIVGSQGSITLLSDSTSSPFVESTDAGRATFVGMPPGNYEAQAAFPGYQFNRLAFIVPDTQAGRFETELHVAKIPMESFTQGPDTSRLETRVRKAMRRGFQALKAGNLMESERQLESAYNAAPRDPDVNFMMGSLASASNHSEQARDYFIRAAELDPRHVPSLVALGRLFVQQGNVAQAAVFLRQAVSLDRKQWAAHLLLADIEFEQHAYLSSREEAEQALRWGGDAAIGAELLVALVCIRQGELEEGRSLLNLYLKDSGNNSPSSETEELVTLLLRSVSDGSAENSNQIQSVEQELIRVAATPKGELALPSWIPAGLDDEQPMVKQVDACPLERILQETSRSVGQFFNNIGNFAATETLMHQQLDKLGQPTAEEVRKYEYLAFLRRGAFAFDEYRNGSLDLEQFPAHIATLGMSGLEVVFHYTLRDNYQFTCVGLGQMYAKPAWIVYFQQKPDRPSLLQSFQVDGISRSIDVKGRAWISADRYQILQIETDLVKPVPAVHLSAEREFVEYRPIQFNVPSVELWLPANVEIYLEFRGRRYRRIDTFSDYKMYSVETRQIIEPPKMPRNIDPR